MQDYKTICDMCAEQEEKFQFERFSRRDALNIGLKLIENAEKQAQPVAVEITVNGLVVFRYFMEGSRPESELWLPIALRGTGAIGSICVSGFDDHLDDHQLVINTLAEYLA